MAFPTDPDTPATAAPPIAWLPSIDTHTLTLVRPTHWARTLGDLRYRPSSWGDRVVRIASDRGTHLLIHRYGAADLALWVPTELAPTVGKPFGLYFHPDRRHLDRIRAAEAFRRAVGLGPRLRSEPMQHAERQAAMLYVHDLAAAGASLRDVAETLFAPMPADWRRSSERSDLRRLLNAASDMVAGGYQRLLESRSRE